MTQGTTDTNVPCPSVVCSAQIWKSMIALYFFACDASIQCWHIAGLWEAVHNQMQRCSVASLVIEI